MDGKELVDDIALVRVKGEIEFNERVQPIKFSAKNGTACTNARITGWGYTHVNTIALLKFQS